MYGSSFCIRKFRPRPSSNMPMEALVRPLPRELTTPPVTKMNLVIEKDSNPLVKTRFYRWRSMLQTVGDFAGKSGLRLALTLAIFFLSLNLECHLKEFGSWRFCRKRLCETGLVRWRRDLVSWAS